MIGGEIRRREDPALLTGHGRYVDDLVLPGLLHAFVVRSPVAHARIMSVDVSEARTAPGVAGVFTAADMDGVGPLPGGEGLPPGAQNPAHHALASEKVLWAGQPVALVVARTPALAADAAELVVVDYAELAAVTDPVKAVADAAVLHESGNVAFVKRLASGDAEGEFARAARVVRQRMVSQRIAPVALEPRGVVAHVADDGRLRVRLPTQRPHGARNWLARILGLPADRIHVSAGDVGGGFGSR
jgi:carbon-monoxide dehydrogenase large subunit